MQQGSLLGQVSLVVAVLRWQRKQFHQLHLVTLPPRHQVLIVFFVPQVYDVTDWYIYYINISLEKYLNYVIFMGCACEQNSFRRQQLGHMTRAIT